MSPAILTALSAFLMRTNSAHAINESVSSAVALLASATSGIICGALLGSLNRDFGARVILSLIASVAMFVVCLILSCFGCTAGGYQLSSTNR